jgi:peptidoglycan/xylan/chitin deacetylase (PgdA/CDA1 family)
MIGPAVSARNARLRVLIYHRIDPRGPEQVELNPDLTTASPIHFEQQLRYLTRAYHPVGATEVLAAFAGRHALPPRAVLLTFDDGYRDFRDVAWPLLKHYRVPAVLFVPTAFVEDPNRMFWSDALWQMIRRSAHPTVTVPGVGVLKLSTPVERLDSFRTTITWLKRGLPPARKEGIAHLADVFGVKPEPTRAVVDWPELRQLAADGVTIGAHSRTHERLDQIDGAVLQAETAGCRDDLVRELGACEPLFAYPYGDADGSAVHALGKAGFTLGFTTLCGVSDVHRAHPLLLRRDDARATMRRFVVRLSEPFARLRTARHPYPKHMRVGR